MKMFAYTPICSFYYSFTTTYYTEFMQDVQKNNKDNARHYKNKYNIHRTPM